MLKKMLLIACVLGFSFTLFAPKKKAGSSKNLSAQNLEIDYIGEGPEFSVEEKCFANYYLNLILSSQKKSSYTPPTLNLVAFLKQEVAKFKDQGPDYQDPVCVCLFIKGLLLPIDEQEFNLYPKMFNHHKENLCSAWEDNYKNILLKNSNNFVKILLKARQKEQSNSADYSDLNRFYFNMQIMLNSQNNNSSSVHCVRFLAKLALLKDLSQENQKKIIELLIIVLTSLAKINQQENLSDDSILEFLDSYLKMNDFLSSLNFNYNDVVLNEKSSPFKDFLIQKWTGVLSLIDGKYSSEHLRKLEKYLLESENNKQVFLDKILYELKIVRMMYPSC